MRNHFDCYQYPIPKLLYLYKVNIKQLNSQVITDQLTQHASRIAVTTGEVESFKTIIKKLEE